MAAVDTVPSIVISLVLSPSLLFRSSWRGLSPAFASFDGDVTPSADNPPSIHPAKIIPPREGVSAARASPPNLPTKPAFVSAVARVTMAPVIAS